MPNETQNPIYKCPVCQTETAKPKGAKIGNEFSSEYGCPRCGIYWIEDFFSRNSLPNILGGDKRKIAALSHWIRIKHEVISKEPPDANGYRKSINLDEQLVNSIINNPPPTPAEQADRFVLWLGSKAPGEYISFQLQDQLSLIGSATPEELRIAIDYLIRKGLVQGKIIRTSSGLSCVDVALSLEGWQYCEKLKRGAADSHKAFMAMQYNDEQLDKIVEDVFKPAVEKTGFKLFKLTDRPKAGLIDDHLRVEIQTSRFLIADLSHDNLGAYWEAGYAEGLGKPVIYTCEKTKFENPDTKPHFDTNHHLTIPWDINNLEEAANQLKATIRATLPEAAKLTDD